jgi:hypothetical protein
MQYYVIITNGVIDMNTNYKGRRSLLPVEVGSLVMGQTQLYAM